MGKATVRLRLRRTGAKRKACYRVVATDRRSPRDGRFIEILGYYDPRKSDEKLNLERVEYWLSVGAQPSDTVQHIIDRARDGVSLKDKKRDYVKRFGKKRETEGEDADELVAKPAAEAEATEPVDGEAAAQLTLILSLQHCYSQDLLVLKIMKNYQNQ